jgi:hypothetical protein
VQKFHIAIVSEGTSQNHTFDQMVDLTQFLIDRGYLLETESQPAQSDSFVPQDEVSPEGSKFLTEFLVTWKAHEFSGVFKIDYLAEAGFADKDGYPENIDLIFYQG